MLPLHQRRVCLQNWERKESHLSPTTTQLKAEGLQPPVWKRSHDSSNKRKPWDSNPQRFLTAAVFKTVSSSGRVTSVLRQRRSDVSGNRTRGLLDENQTILPSESTTPFCCFDRSEYRIGVSISFLLPEKQPT